MSFVKTFSGLFENYTFVARPARTFSSSSSGITGSVKVFSQASYTQKYESGSYYFNDSGINSSLLSAQTQSNDVSSAITNYMNSVGLLPTSGNLNKTVVIDRKEPGFYDDSDRQIKNITRKILFPYYKVAYPTSHWGCSNYLCLNFMSGSESFGSGSSLIYANPVVDKQPLLTPSGSFTFEFYVKPTSREIGKYHAGTIMHVSSSFAISLISGSQVDPYGKPETFKIMMQLSSSADIAPSKADFNGVYPSDLIFTSSDLVTFNGWHHIAIRWGGTEYDFGSGSFFIDGKNAGNFHVPSSSLTHVDDSTSALFIGNYYDSGNSIDGFFKSDASSDEGFTNPFSSSDDIPNCDLSHPLGAELHEIRIWQEFRDISLIESGALRGITPTDSLRFYLGPHFSHESLSRKVLYTPFDTYVTATVEPFAAKLSFGVGGHLINAENHLKDYVNDYYPRLYNMTASIAPTNEGGQANDYLFASSSILKKNFMIMPCDNGKFVPNFSLYETTGSSQFFRGSPANITLENMQLGSLNASGSTGMLPEDLSGTANENTLIIYDRTFDNSSNLVSIFNISNLFYGSKIHPGSFTISDLDFTGSEGLLSFSLKDNELGSLYRADATTPHAKWSSVGTVLYEEGIAAITSPYFGDLFGKNSFSVNFKGEQQIPVLTTNVVLPKYQINSSSQTSYIPLTASDYANEVGEPIVYVNRINLHDENLNVIGRAELSQPISKRPSDKFLIKVKFDF